MGDLKESWGFEPKKITANKADIKKIEKLIKKNGEYKDWKGTQHIQGERHTEFYYLKSMYEYKQKNIQFEINQLRTIFPFINSFTLTIKQSNPVAWIVFNNKGKLLQETFRDQPLEQTQALLNAALQLVSEIEK